MEGRKTEPARTSLIRKVRDLEETQACCKNRTEKWKNVANTNSERVVLPAVNSFGRQNIREEYLHKLAQVEQLIPPAS